MENVVAFEFRLRAKKCILELEPLDKGNKQKQIKNAKITPRFSDESDFFHMPHRWLLCSKQIKTIFLI